MEAKNIIADNFFGMIKNLSSDVRLELMSRISNSLKELPDNNDSWKKLFGAYHSSESAEDIILDLRNSRNTNRKIEDL
jgi:hypothetical protein